MTNLGKSIRIVALILFSLLVIEGCGGGNGHGGSGTPPPPPGPTLSSIVPSSVVAGASGLLVQANGTDFATSSTVQWNGSSLQTTFVSSTQLTALIPASDLASVGTAQVSISDHIAGVGNSGNLPFTIAAPLVESTWVRALNYTPKDIAWDAVHGKLLASMGTGDATNPNTLLVINPISGKVETTVHTGNNPNLLSISSDGSYLWVGLDGDSAVQRFTLPDLQKDVTIPLPLDQSGNPQQAVSLEAARSNPHTVAVDVGHWGYSPPGWNVFVFDDSVQRQAAVNVLAAGLPKIDWLQWGKDDSTIYGTQYTTIDSPGGVVSMNVNSSGVALLPGDGGFPGGTGMYSYFSPTTGLMYSSTRVADPAQLANVGEYNLLGDAWQCVPDAAIGRYYCLVEPQLYGPSAELWVFDLAKFNLLERVDLSGVLTGSFGRLIRWGQAGLALISVSGVYAGSGGLFLIDGAAINPNVPSDTPSGTATIVYPLMFGLKPESALVGSSDVTVSVTGQNFTPDSVGCWSCNYLQLRMIQTTYVSATQLQVTVPAAALQSAGPLFISIYDPVRNSFATNSLTFTVLPGSNSSTKLAAMNLDGLATAWDKTASVLYVGTGGLDRAYPSSIVSVDPTTATVKNSVQVSPFPYILSISAQDQFLYVGFEEASLETQLALPGFSPTLTWPLSNPSFENDLSFGNQFYAGDLQAAPQNPHTTAVSLYNYAFSPVATGGLTVYDDQIQRPNIVPGWTRGNDIDVLAWGKMDSILIGSQNDFYGLQTDYLFSADSSGVSLLSSGPSNFNAAGAYIHSDFGTGLVYSDDGNVADPSTGQVVGTINASGIVVPDSALNRIFVLTQSQAQANSNDYTIISFDETTYSLVSTIAVQNLLGFPFSMGVCGDHCLAVLTFNGNWGPYYGPVGMLYLISDTTFVSETLHPSGNTSLTKGELAMRWKRPSRTEVVRRQRFRREN